MMVACSMPASSMTAVISRMRSSKEPPPRYLSDSPVPRLSKEITRPSAPKRSANLRQGSISKINSVCQIVPGTMMMSREPLPHCF
jgi:hypothetical protein